MIHMFNKKNTAFLGIIAIFFVMLFVSGCKKAEIYDLDTTNNEEVSQDNSNNVNTIEEELSIVEDTKEQNSKTLLETKEEVKEDKTIIFEDLVWKTYKNNILGYSIDYPTIINIMGNDLDQHVEFTGPLSNNEWWPKISISHYNNDFYKPQEDVSVADLVKAFPEYTLGEEISIAGLDTVHYVQAKTPQAFAADYFYFIKDNQLYNITIIHSNDRQDWKLYNKMLDSFEFDDTAEIE